MSITLDGTNGITSSGAIVSSETVSDGTGNVVRGRRNLLINGDMKIIQRWNTTNDIGNEGAATYGPGYWGPDRWYFSEVGTTTARFTMTNENDAPSEFAKSLKINTTTADVTLDATDVLRLMQRVEASTLQHLQWGTSSAKNLVVSGWIKTNKVGDWTLHCYQEDASRYISRTINIDTSGVWTYFEEQIPGDTSGQINNDNGSGLQIGLVLGAGTNYTSGSQATSWETFTAANECDPDQVNLFSATSNYLQITGWQLEVGDVATEYEHLHYAEQLALCQRYYQSFKYTNPSVGLASGVFYTTTTAQCVQQLPVTMRDDPTCVRRGTLIDFAILSSLSAPTVTALTVSGTANTMTYTVTQSGATTDGHGAVLRIDGSASWVEADAEL